MTDQEWSLSIRKKFPICVRCKTEPSTDAAHIIPKSVAPELRHDLDNGLGLCRLCHERCDHFDRDEIIEVAKSVIGEDRVSKLLNRRYKKEEL